MWEPCLFIKLNALLMWQVADVAQVKNSALLGTERDMLKNAISVKKLYAAVFARCGINFGPYWILILVKFSFVGEGCRLACKHLAANIAWEMVFADVVSWKLGPGIEHFIRHFSGGFKKH